MEKPGNAGRSAKGRGDHEGTEGGGRFMLMRACPGGGMNGRDPSRRSLWGTWLLQDFSLTKQTQRQTYFLWWL